MLELAGKAELGSVILMFREVEVQLLRSLKHFPKCIQKKKYILCIFASWNSLKTLAIALLVIGHTKYLLLMARHKKRLNRRQLITHLHEIFFAICRKKKVCLTCGRGMEEARVRADEKETLGHCNSLAWRVSKSSNGQPHLCGPCDWVTHWT